MDILDIAAPRQMSRDIGDLISSIQSDQFYDSLLSFISRYIPFSNGYALKVLNDELHVLHYGSPSPYEWLEEYTSGYHLLDPVWTLMKGPELSLKKYRLSDTAPDGFARSSYYKEHYKKARIVDEIGLISKTDQDEKVLICLMRRWDTSAFEENYLQLLDILQPIISSSIAMHERAELVSAKRLRPNEAVDSKPEDVFAGSPAKKINEYLEMGGNRKNVLSLRQTSIVDLILRGHSTESIGLNLSIAPTTVKTHKRHIYARLGISSHGELFNLFVMALRR